MLDFVVLGGTKESKEVGDVRVDTAVGDETQKVESRAVLSRVLERVDDGGLFLKFVLLDCYYSAMS